VRDRSVGGQHGAAEHRCRLQIQADGHREHRRRRYDGVLGEPAHGVHRQRCAVGAVQAGRAVVERAPHAVEPEERLTQVVTPLFCRRTCPATPRMARRICGVMRIRAHSGRLRERSHGYAKVGRNCADRPTYRREKPSRRYTGVRGIKPSLNSAWRVEGRGDRRNGGTRCQRMRTIFPEVSPGPRARVEWPRSPRRRSRTPHPPERQPDGPGGERGVALNRTSTAACTPLPWPAGCKVKVSSACCTWAATAPVVLVEFRGRAVRRPKDRSPT